MHKVTWTDLNREPKEKPNPLYPNGMDIDTVGNAKSCKVDLPYPAKRCGIYKVYCEECGYLAAITTAGRPDDPKSVKLPCKLEQPPYWSGTGRSGNGGDI